ncbi:MAG: rod shape-determining protein MreC [Anaerolineaceae bacterium 4572_32.2]|nr:MAG: rod shape-determining protein MreC [Anaerolineaceae bacterium 4572_32.2]
MKQSPQRSWLPLVLLVIGLLLLVFHESGYLAPAENVLHYVLDPLQRVFSSMVESTGDVFQTVREVRKLRIQVEELQAQTDALTVENVRLREYEAEVQQLRALLNFTGEYPISAFLGAEVVGQEACDTFPCGKVLSTDPNPYLRYVTINVGARQGVKVGMPVVSSGAGLVGRIAQVNPRTAKVKLLTDADSQVAALLQTSRVSGLVVGQPDGTLLMQYIPQEDSIGDDEIVLTSGLGGTLPKGLVIGQVTKVLQEDYELFQAAIVRPAVDLSRLELVLVITAFEQIPIEEP